MGFSLIDLEKYREIWKVNASVTGRMRENMLWMIFETGVAVWENSRTRAYRDHCSNTFALVMRCSFLIHLLEGHNPSYLIQARTNRNKMK